MLYIKFLVALALSTSCLDVAIAQGRGKRQSQNNQNGQNNQGNQNGGQRQGQGATGTTGNNAQAVLDSANIQTGSASDGQGNADGVKAGQAKSAT